MGEAVSERRGSVWALAVVVAIGLATNAGPAAPASEAEPGATVPGSENGRVAFVSDRDGNPEVYSMSLDGSDVRRLTDDSASDYDPAISPDGSKIAFSRYRDGVAEIFVVGADGSGLRQLTDHPDGTFDPDNSDYDPAFSPDGSKIAFANRGDVWVMDADGSGQGYLAGDPGRTDDEPGWSPDGRKIAYGSSVYDWDLMRYFSDIRVVGADGSADAPILGGPEEDWDPSWSPDGTRIAFARESGSDGMRIYAAAPDGTAPARLTDNPGGYDSAPSWGPAPGANSAPRVTRVSPAPGSGTRDRTPTIRATVRDAQDDLARADITLHVDGRRVHRFSYDRETDRLSYAGGRLSYGAHAVKITAADPEGLRAAKSWRFHVRR